MTLDIEKIKGSAHADFRKTWLDTAKLVPEDGPDFMTGMGKPHMMHETINKVRGVFLDLGFDEVENQVFLPEEDVYKQYGPEAPVILDRCYYLGGLPRPDIGLSSKKMEQVVQVADIAEEDLKGIFRRYREGSIEGDDVLETMVSELSVTTEEATEVLGLFSEFRGIKPVCGKTTLRSHMTGAWFPTLAALADEVPRKLFSCGMRFRREQKIDASHLRAHYGGSCVVMSPDISLKAGMRLTEAILNALDFGEVTYVNKRATSNYYAPKTEYEVFSGDIEVADIGMYSPVALAEYGIEYNVFNLGFGLERILMVKNKIADVRDVLYPQFYGTNAITDQELAGMLEIAKGPDTQEGESVAEGLKKAFSDNSTVSSPCSFNAYQGPLYGKEIVVEALEREDKSRLAGPAALNDVYVHEGAIYGLPKDTSKLRFDVSDILEKGIKAPFGFLDAICSLFAHDIEEAVISGEDRGSYQVKMAKGPGDVNIGLSGKARRFISANNKQISIKGPVFLACDFRLR